MSIRVLGAGDAARFHAFRLESLSACPEAFGATYEEESKFSAEEIASRMGSTPDDFVLGAFDDKRLVGILGFQRQARVKRRHGGHIWGLYVAPEARGKGIGRMLLTEAIARARRIEGLDLLDLGVVTTGVTARKLYVAHGFISYGVEPRAHKQGETWFDMEHMVLMLR